MSEYLPFDLEVAKKEPERVVWVKGNGLDAWKWSCTQVLSLLDGKIVTYAENTAILWNDDATNVMYPSERLALKPKPKKQVTLTANIYRDFRGEYYGFVHDPVKNERQKQETCIITVPITFEVEQ